MSLGSSEKPKKTAVRAGRERRDEMRTDDCADLGNVASLHSGFNITIGKDCWIGPGAMMLDVMPSEFNKACFSLFEVYNVQGRSLMIRNSVTIGDRTMIGPNVQVSRSLLSSLLPLRDLLTSTSFIHTSTLSLSSTPPPTLCLQKSAMVSTVENPPTPSKSAQTSGSVEQPSSWVE